MKFADIYDFAAGHEQPSINVHKLADRVVLHHKEVGDVKFWPVTLDENVTLGYMRFEKDRSSGYGEEFLVANVRYSDTLNRCWRRFVCCKELMHVFDLEAERTNNMGRFMQLMKELETAPMAGDASPMLASEFNTQWMALAALCPLPLREKYKAAWQADEVSDYEIALKFLVPEACVKSLMSDYFETAVARLLKR